MDPRFTFGPRHTTWEPLLIYRFFCHVKNCEAGQKAVVEEIFRCLTEVKEALQQCKAKSCIQTLIEVNINIAEKCASVCITDALMCKKHFTVVFGQCGAVLN